MEKEQKERLEAQLGSLDGLNVEGEGPSGKRAASVATIIELLIEAGEANPVPVSFLLEEADSDISQMGPAFLSLEIAGCINRYSYDNGGRKPATAYALCEGVLSDE